MIDFVEDKETVIGVVESFSFEDKKEIGLHDKDVAGVLNFPFIRSFVVYDGEQAVAILLLAKIQNFLQTPMFVFKNFRNKGFGGKIIEYTQKIAKKEGFDGVLHNIRRDNLAMRKLSEKHGFRDSGINFDAMSTALIKEV